MLPIPEAILSCRPPPFLGIYDIFEPNRRPVFICYATQPDNDAPGFRAAKDPTLWDKVLRLMSRAIRTQTQGSSILDLGLSGTTPKGSTAEFTTKHLSNNYPTS